MKKLLAVLGAGLVIAGCSSIIPPITINNAFGLQGKTTTINLGASSQATGTINVTATFDDIQNLTVPLSPQSFNLKLAIQAVSFGAGCPNPLPSSVSVTIPSVNATLSDGSGQSARNATASATNVQFTVTVSGGTASVGSITNDTLTFTSPSTLLSILQTGGTNTATLAATLNAVSTPDLAGCSMTVTWGNVAGEIKL